ncbi:MAG: hypothetical protein LBQ59_01135 [Candidatus Peribacteria bacterium]|nr:hypothetical protein [Candidatus Peribacteria bacterium]
MFQIFETFIPQPLSPSQEKGELLFFLPSPLKGEGWGEGSNFILHILYPKTFCNSFKILFT